MTARRWRPSLGLVLGGALAATLVMSLIGLVVLRYLGEDIGFRPAALIVAAVIALATAGLGWLMVRLLLRPIHALERYALSLGQAPAPLHYGTAELHVTARRVIAMAEALKDRETTVRAFTDHVTHELKTPVAGIRAAVELMQDGNALTSEDARLLAQIDTARAQIEVQLAALRRVTQAREVRYLGHSTLEQALALVPLNDLQLVTEGHDSLPISPEGLAVVLGHLLGNAAAHGAGQVMLRIGPNGLTIQDDGPGISEGNRDRVFDPFFTTRREAGGTGMGLAITRNILAAHGGQIDLVPTPKGACFSIRFMAD